MPETELTLAPLSEGIMGARERFHVDAETDLTHVVKMWQDEDQVAGVPSPALTVVMRTRGCTWDYQHGCTMCGYFTETAQRKVSPEQLLAQYEGVEPKLADRDVFKIYTGGNFLDDKEVFPEVRQAIVGRAARHVKKITFESRPEYCTPERLEQVSEWAAKENARIEIGIGLESTSDLVCDQAINKGYGFADFRQAAKRCRDAAVLVKAYLLLKPPFLTEHEAVEDMVSSVEEAAPHSDVLSVNPTNVQKFTLVERMFDRREYRPPWLWSVLEVLRRGKPVAGDVRLQSDPVGGGTRRGAHNCGTCDKAVLHRISQYNRSQDLAFVEAAESVACTCRAEYDAVRRLEGFLVGGAYL